MLQGGGPTVALMLLTPIDTNLTHSLPQTHLDVHLHNSCPQCPQGGCQQISTLHLAICTMEAHSV